MMRAAILLIPLLLSGCEPVGDDGYEFKRRTLHRDTVTITRVLYASTAELRAEARRRKIKPDQPGRPIFGFAVVDTVRPFCTMHVVDPLKDYQASRIGHETTHCFDGRWHD